MNKEADGVQKYLIDDDLRKATDLYCNHLSKTRYYLSKLTDSKRYLEGALRDLKQNQFNFSDGKGVKHEAFIDSSNNFHVRLRKNCYKNFELKKL